MTRGLVGEEAFRCASRLANKLQPFLATLKCPHGFTAQKKRTDFRTMQDVFD
jgi:hypothetical protein